MGELTTKLSDMRARFREKAEPRRVIDYDRGVQDIVDRRIVEQAKHVGDRAPDFELPNAVGKRVRLSEELQKGPVVLTWYRGGWCPICHMALRSLQSFLPDFKARGASLLAIAPETPDNSLSTKEKDELEFEVLSDVDNRVAKEYGIVFTVPDFVMAYYNDMFDLAAYNGNDKNELPLAATYLVGSDGIIAYEFVHHDYRYRADPEDILVALAGRPS